MLDSDFFYVWVYKPPHPASQGATAKVSVTVVQHWLRQFFMERGSEDIVYLREPGRRVIPHLPVPAGTKSVNVVQSCYLESIQLSLMLQQPKHL